MFAVAVAPEPTATECSGAPPGAVTRKTQGQVPPATLTVYVPSAWVMPLALPAAHLTSIVPPAIAAPVAAVPLTLNVMGAGLSDEPLPPHAASATHTTGAKAERTRCHAALANAKCMATSPSKS
jgi:hypothetical protein